MQIFIAGKLLHKSIKSYKHLYVHIIYTYTHDILLDGVFQKRFTAKQFMLPHSSRQYCHTLDAVRSKLSKETNFSHKVSSTLQLEKPLTTTTPVQFKVYNNYNKMRLSILRPGLVIMLMD